MKGGDLGVDNQEAVETRRSIPKFLPDDVPEAILMELIEAARLAPSGCNAQPWRFKIVQDRETRIQFAQASHNQSSIVQAPAVLVCCGDIQAYLDGTVSGALDLKEIGAVKENTPIAFITALTTSQFTTFLPWGRKSPSTWPLL